MGHVEQLAECILFLGGDNEMTPARPVAKIKEALEILTWAAEMERESAAFYNSAAAQCGERRDAAYLAEPPATSSNA